MLKSIIESRPTEEKPEQDIYTTEKKKISEAMIKNGFMDGEVSIKVIKNGDKYELYVTGTRYNKSEDPLDNIPTIGVININNYGGQDFDQEEIKKIADRELELLLETGREEHPIDEIVEEVTGRKSDGLLNKNE